MSGRHLTDEMLQAYALDPSTVKPEITSHLAYCADCRAAAAAYVRVVEALGGQPAPAFTFDLAAAVMARLDSTVVAAEPVSKSGRWLTFLVCVVLVAIAAVPVWLFRKTVYFVFSDLSAEFISMIACAAGVAVLLKLHQYYRRYQQVLHLINE